MPVFYICFRWPRSTKVGECSQKGLLRCDLEGEIGHWGGKLPELSTILYCCWHAFMFVVCKKIRRACVCWQDVAFVSLFSWIAGFLIMISCFLLEGKRHCFVLKPKACCPLSSVISQLRNQLITELRWQLWSMEYQQFCHSKRRTTLPQKCYTSEDAEAFWTMT